MSLALLIASVLLLSSTTGRPAETTFKEYQIKAAFLYNFTQFVEWPTNAFPDTNTALIIGILGNDPFGNTLDDIVRDEKVNGHPLVIKRFRRLEEVKDKDCHILFVSQSEISRLDEILGALKSRAILTVGETENFAKNGGMIRFITEKNKTRLRINTDAAKGGNLIISAKLLRLAEIIPPKKE